MVKVKLSYPESMRRDIEKRGIQWWAKGGKYESFSDAIDEAKVIAEEMNFPIQVSYMGQKMTVYPKAIGY